VERALQKKEKVGHKREEDLYRRTRRKNTGRKKVARGKDLLYESQQAPTSTLGNKKCQAKKELQL